jgi:hypothetical protein
MGTKKTSICWAFYFAEIGSERLERYCGMDFVNLLTLIRDGRWERLSKFPLNLRLRQSGRRLQPGSEISSGYHMSYLSDAFFPPIPDADRLVA